ncbi:metallophosphoesterase family protein [Jannaschia seohaensis]|uniref:DNA repair exonuclease SbcCD nuclease subunit n=1 Tax=Jannaschia seohaensis TaxID=475081 RepID=A0A2Y9APX7_9RHOB|nr:DNA repair exonuclease [Jannaschia seohaensis]PWJ20431.1 DNA repair exonuclease SbcCD nuclease subunit [Jannaschia seohaensis]SSA44517.1 DNA repair exonuclease SbcCD nuclease subunit [Jannaschia seohaensis]
MALRFIHTADLHLGKSFGGYAEADRLRVARRAVVARLTAAAREAGAHDILVAGDLFETPNPSAATWRQAVAEMAEAADLTWWLLPGNHDNLREGRATWEGIAALGHGNLRVLDRPEPVEMRPGAVLLPAPVASRRGIDDPTAWMDACETPPDALRIGLAHGPVRSFGEGEGAEVIAPDRDRRARLDYLALGDWHGMIDLSERTRYSGAPERTDFRHAGPGVCLSVEVSEPGTTPKVTPIQTGVFDWRRLVLDLVPQDDSCARLDAVLPESARRDVMLQIEARGRVPLREASALAAYAAALAPDFAHFELRDAALATEVEAVDLDAIAPAGALRQAGDALVARAEDPALSERERAVAAAALRRLHGLAAQ